MSYLPDYCILALVPTFEEANTSSYFYRLVLTGEGLLLLGYLWSHSPVLDLGREATYDLGYKTVSQAWIPSGPLALWGHGWAPLLEAFWMGRIVSGLAAQMGRPAAHRSS